MRTTLASPDGSDWYEECGWLSPGTALAVNDTDQPERVLPPGESA